MSGEGPEGREGAEKPGETQVSSVCDANGTPAWRILPADHVRPDGFPTEVLDPSRLETPLLKRILKVLREEYDPEFAIRWLGPVPSARLRKPLSESRIALITTACLHLKGDRPFDPYSDRWGDPSYRLIPHLTSPGDLDLEADYVDEKYLRSDPEVALPMRSLQHCVDVGQVGSSAARHVSFCEGVVRPLPDLVESTREAIRGFRSDGVDGALVLPTCSLCVLNVCLIAREVEAAGMPTATLTPLPELTGIVGVPRSLTVRFPLGAPCGNPGNSDLHRRVVGAALERLVQEPGSRESAELDAAWRG